MQRLLLIHTASMLVLGAVRTDGVGDLLDEVVTRCLSGIFGPRAAKAINTYLNPTIAANDPVEYVSRLRRLMGEVASNVILRRIEDSLCEKVGLQKHEWNSFVECVEAVKSKFTT